MHCVQELPATELYDPAGHDVQAILEVEPGRLDVPTEQAEQTVASAPLNLPGAHCAQEVTPFTPFQVPASQAEHGKVPVELHQPRGHSAVHRSLEPEPEELHVPWEREREQKQGS